MDETARTAGEALEEVRARRERLRAAMLDLEAAVAAPAPGRVADWRERLAAALDEVAAAVEDHVRETEAPDGLLARVAADVPRLAHRVARLRAEHATLRSTVGRARTPIVGDGDDEQVVAVMRSAALDLVRALAHHRHTGADLLYEAYNVDLGDGE